MKRLFVVFIVLASCSYLMAESLYWYGAVDRNWTTPGNWGDSYNTAPGYVHNVYILDGQLPIGDSPTCNFEAGTICEVWNVRVQSMGYNGVADFNMTGGELTAEEFFIGEGAPGKGVMTMRGGKLVSTTYFVIGQAGGNGELNMTGGEINALNFWVSNLANSVGKVNLKGGTINISGTISIEGINGGIGAEPTGNGVIDLAGGTIVITKNEDLRGYVYAWANAGFITAYGGSGTVVAELDSITGYTSFHGVPYLGQTRYWYNDGTDDLWTTAANWGDAFNSAPLSGDSVLILNGQEPIGNTNTCLFTSGMNADLASLIVQGLGFTGDANLAISGGNIVANEFFISTGQAGTGKVVITDGNIACASYMVVGHGPASDGTLEMLGGTITANNFWVSNQSGSKGRVLLHGGTINITGTLAVDTATDCNGLIDITEGKIVIQKDEDLVWMGPWLAKNKRMTAYANSGHIISWRDPETGWTTIAATPTAGDFTGDSIVDIEDFIQFCENWLDGGTYGTSPDDLGYGYTPYDLNYDGKVNFQDFALMAANW
jgi:hypothetical protein